MEIGVTMRKHSSASGFSLIETVIAMGVLATGMLGAAAVMSAGMQGVSSSPRDLIAIQKATEAIESVFSARDSHVLTWSQIRNVKGVSGSDNGVFLDGPQSLVLAGPDGLVNTADDASQPGESFLLPGKDQMLGTSDDTTQTLTDYTREIKIADVAGEVDVNGICMLRSITVNVIYQSGPTKRTYSLVTYISSYS